MSAHDVCRRLGRGVNIIGYDPIWKDRSLARFQARHMAAIKEAGFSSVRINLHPFAHMADGPDHVLNPAWLETLDWAIGQALDCGLLAIVDFHEFGAMGRDPLGCLPRMNAFWQQAASRYASQPQEVVFEVLNEPCSSLTPELWNEILVQPLSIIRSHNPDRAAILGPGQWNAIDALPSLQLPVDDPCLILTVHYYLPMEFTHQGAPWNPATPKTGIEWQGADKEIAAIRSDFSRAQAWAAQRSLPVYLGEFGAYDKGDMGSRVRYTGAVAREAEALGWSWGCWQFDSDFLLWDMSKDRWVEPLIRALMPST